MVAVFLSLLRASSRWLRILSVTKTSDGSSQLEAVCLEESRLCFSFCESCWII